VRALLLSDIHSNLEALDACLAAAPPHDCVVNLGDLVDYGASPNEVIQRARGLGEFFVRGNHDKAAAGLLDLETFNPLAALSGVWTRNQLTAANLQWLRDLPAGPLKIDSFPGVQFVHGSPLDEDDYIVNLHDAIEPLLLSTIPVTFFGHTHQQGCFSTDSFNSDVFRPFYQTIGQPETAAFPLKADIRYLVNPGSVGQPRDGDWRAAFALYDDTRGLFTWYRTPYDRLKAQRSIRRAGLPDFLADRLAIGR
jgi:diadenosine tetraphosphatase ApaH/serine/threonine PP2A family protein phosphatase